MSPGSRPAPPEPDTLAPAPAGGAAPPEPDTGGIGVGRVLAGRYRVVGRVGAGGMATIFKAVDAAMERDVAVKVIHAHLADDPALRERFRTEARHAAALSHPSIVNVFDQGVADLPYIVMELVDGPSLREVLLDRGRLSPAEALAVVEPVCAALARAHAAGVIHRDIKPENVLISPEGVPKVADFGIARAVAATSHTATGTLIGSVHYMAPELVDGRDATPASDQYAVGVLLYELLTGRKPLPADTPMAVALRHAREAVPPPSRAVGGVPKALDRVVARATALKPGRRFPDMGALATALWAAVPGGARPVVAAGPDGRERTLVLPVAAQATMSEASAADLDRRQRPAGGDRPAARPMTASRPGPSPGAAAPTRPSSAAARPPAVAARPPSGPARTPSAPARPPSRPARPPSAPRPVRRRASAVLSAILLTLLLLAGVAGGSYAVWDRVIAPLEGVPRLVGLPQDQAFAALQERGLSLVAADPVHSLDVPEGAVVSSDPAAGMQLRRGGTVTAVLSAGPRSVAMPQVLGLPEEEALALLAPHAFEVSRDEAFSDDVPRGQVLAQVPEPDAAVEEGAGVQLTISLGIEQVEVPNLARATREEAQALLAEAKLTGDFREEYSDEVPEAGRVVHASLAPGQTVDKGTTVEVVVSLGPVTFAMPDVRGDAIGDGKAALEAEGLVVEVVARERTVFGPFVRGRVGLVEEQLPQPGETVERGDAVTLYTYSE